MWARGWERESYLRSQLNMHRKHRYRTVAALIITIIIILIFMIITINFTIFSLADDFSTAGHNSFVRMEVERHCRRMREIFGPSRLWRSAGKGSWTFY